MTIKTKDMEKTVFSLDKTNRTVKISNSKGSSIFNYRELRAEIKRVRTQMEEYRWYLATDEGSDNPMVIAHLSLLSDWFYQLIEADELLDYIHLNN